VLQLELGLLEVLRDGGARDAKAKRRRGGAEKAAEDRLEGMVADFKARMFGGLQSGKGGGEGAGGKGAAGAGGAIRRWFD
jgi:hypothetical protein